MTKKKKTNRKPHRRILSVGPITSREIIGHTLQHKNLRTAMTVQLRCALKKQERNKKDIKRLRALIKAYGKKY